MEVLLPFEGLIDVGVDVNRLTGEVLYESANALLELRDRKKFVGVNAIIDLMEISKVVNTVFLV